VKNLDDEISTYFLSEVRDESNEAIKKGFWKSHDLERLPYERGNLIALILDRALVATGSSLDALMKTLVAEAHLGKTVSVDKLLARMPPATAAILKKTIVDGATLSVDPQLLAPCLAMTTRTVGRFELGFDFGATQASRKVSGVVPGSRAAAAGLHDGDPITGWSINYGKPEIPVELQLGGRTLTYLPQGAPVEVPVFSVADAAACRSIL
jgi:predicted metalloprotease with PDZ domain